MSNRVLDAHQLVTDDPASSSSDATNPANGRDALARSAWPMIHGTPGGTKNSPPPGPTTGPVTVDRFVGRSPSIVTTLDDGLFYLQVQKNFLFCFADGNLQKPLGREALGASFPAVGGNTIDREGHVFLTLSCHGVSTTARP